MSPCSYKVIFHKGVPIMGEGLFGLSIVWIIPFQTNLPRLESVENESIVFQLIKVFICRISKILEF